MKIKVPCKKCQRMVTINVYHCDDPDNPPSILVICNKCIKSKDNAKENDKGKDNVEVSEDR